MPSHTDHIYRMTWAGRNNTNGDYWEVVHHYFWDMLGAENQIEALNLLMPAIDTAVTGLFALALPTNCYIDTLNGRRVDGPGGPTLARIIDQGGGRAGDMENLATGPQVTWFGSEDPILMGRTYLPGNSVTDWNGTAWTAPFIAAVEDWITGVIAPVAIAGHDDAQFVIRSVQIGVAAQDVQSGLLRAIPGTQRRRLRR